MVDFIGYQVKQRWEKWKNDEKAKNAQSRFHGKNYSEVILDKPYCLLDTGYSTVPGKVTGKKVRSTS